MYLHITVRKKAVAILALLLAACITYAFVHPALRYKQAHSSCSHYYVPRFTKGS